MEPQERKHLWTETANGEHVSIDFDEAAQEFTIYVDDWFNNACMTLPRQQFEGMINAIRDRLSGNESW